MSIIRKFKDFFKEKIDPVERRRLISNRVHEDLVGMLETAKSDMRDLLYDFEDLGFSIKISPTTSHEGLGRGKDSPGTWVGYLHTALEIKDKDPRNLEPNFETDLRRSLIELSFRMKEIPNLEIDRDQFRYEGRYLNYRNESFKNGDLIFMGFFGTTPERALSDSNSYIVKISKGDKVLKLTNLTINIYTKPIKIPY